METGIQQYGLRLASKYSIQNVFRYLHDKDPERPLVRVGDYIFDELFDESNRGVDSRGTPCLLEGPASWLITSNEETIGTDVPPAYDELKETILEQCEDDLSYDETLLDGIDRPTQLRLHTLAKLAIRESWYDWHQTRLVDNFELNAEAGVSEFMGHYYETDPSVFVPRDETRPFSWVINNAITAYTLKRESDEYIKYLDIGCGTGNLAIHSVVANDRVLAHAVDINPDAVNLANDNFIAIRLSMLEILQFTARLHKYNGIPRSSADIKKIDVEEAFDRYFKIPGSNAARFLAYESDAYEAVEDERFDVISYDAPRRPFKDDNVDEIEQRAYTDPWYESLRKVVGGAEGHLSEDGVLMLTFSSAGDTDFLDDLILAHGLNHRVRGIRPHEFSGKNVKQFIYSVSRNGPLARSNDARRPLRPFVHMGMQYNPLTDTIRHAND